MAANEAFQRFDHGHDDLVLSVDYNYYGTRMATASSDHRLKIWDLVNGQWTVTDVWTAHDAEITSVKWNGPFVGEIVASIAEDGMLRIWQEDLLQPPNTGRRFKRIYEQLSSSRVPFMSLDFKNLGNETYLALTSRDGQLTVCEPIDHDDLSEWSIMWQTYLCKSASRTEETGFAVCWHHEKFPAWPAVLAGLDRRSLALAVAVMDVVKVYRTDKDRRFFLAAELDGARNLIRDVAWANGSMRGFDTIATASKDGFIRLYDIHTPEADKLSTSETDQVSEETKLPKDQPPARSGIGAGLAIDARNTKDGDEARPGKIVQTAKLVAELPAHENAVWRVNFSLMGEMLISTGDDGLVDVWKKDLEQQWKRYAEIDATLQV